MSDKAVPPLIFGDAYRRLAEHYKNLPFESARMIPYDYEKAVSIKTTAQQIAQTLAKHFNQENPMNQKPTPVFTPGDRLHISQPFAALSTEVVFLGFDPEQKHLAMIRDASNKNAPILLIHYDNLRIPPKKPVEHVGEVFLYAYGASIRIKDFREFPSMHHLNDFISGTRTLKAIDAMVTEDGTVVLKYIETEPEEDALRAAYEKPVTAFTGADSVSYVR